MYLDFRKHVKNINDMAKWKARKRVVWNLGFASSTFFDAFPALLQPIYSDCFKAFNNMPQGAFRTWKKPVLPTLFLQFIQAHSLILTSRLTYSDKPITVFQYSHIRAHVPCQHAFIFPTNTPSYYPITRVLSSYFDRGKRLLRPK